MLCREERTSMGTVIANLRQHRGYSVKIQRAVSQESLVARMTGAKIEREKEHMAAFASLGVGESPRMRRAMEKGT
jgi:hypothetical protein